MPSGKPSPSRLASVLSNLNAEPRLNLKSLKSLKLSLAFRNDHFGARHFVKEQLPRIRWANPNLQIQVETWRKTKDEEWRPEMELTFDNGTAQSIDMHEKWSSAILKELMDVAGGEHWKQWKREALSAGKPIVPGEENETKVIKRTRKTTLPTLDEFRTRAKSTATSTETPIPDSLPKTGVAAALP
ncbi:hypothetical protein H0H93_005011 [Arthromyces matolae]|nr:hypothetical protein H0H93_005011 [Arthromyces matolae]